MKYNMTRCLPQEVYNLIEGIKVVKLLEAYDKIPNASCRQEIQ